MTGSSFCASDGFAGFRGVRVSMFVIWLLLPAVVGTPSAFTGYQAATDG